MKVGKHDAFERKYMGKFRLMASEFGEFVEYERDRAARDIGLHLITSKSDGGELISPALAWFQLKGIHATTLDAATFEASGALDIRLETQHLRLWYILPEPTYLVVFVEAMDTFYVTDIKKYITENFGDEILTDDRKSLSVKLSKESPLDEQAFRLILLRNNIKAWQTQIHDDEKIAAVFFRDATLIKRISTAEERGVEIRFLLRKYMSKMRSEAYLSEHQIDGDGDDEVIHTHWHYAMPDPEVAFPYLQLAPELDHDDSDCWYDDEDNFEWPALELSNGRLVQPDSGFEICEYRMKATLNALGLAWLKTLKTMEIAGFIEIPEDTAMMVSVAPWHSREV